MIYVKGDLLDLAEGGVFDAIVHGCNCFNAMGAGIAREIAKRYPSAVIADNGTIRGDKNKLGTYSVGIATATNSSSACIIINAYTQYKPSIGEDVFEYEAFAKILDDLVKVFNEPDDRIGFPLIGCGLAGGDKDRIMQMIEDHLASKIPGTVTIVEWDK